MASRSQSIALTTDIEADGGGFPGRERTFVSFRTLPRLLDTLNERSIPFTAFVEGEILANRPQLIEPLVNYGVSIESHGYDHSNVSDSSDRRIENMERGIEAYYRFFKTGPRGFRSPQGITGPEDLARLSTLGVEYDSSVFPCYFPGRFSNFSSPVTPYRYHAGLIELPVGVLGPFRYPMGLSYVQLIGWRAFRFLFDNFDKPETFVFNLHLHDLSLSNWHLQDGLPRSIRFGYMATLRGDPFATFGAFLDHAMQKGYRFTTMDAWLDNLDIDTLPLNNLPEKVTKARGNACPRLPRR